MTVIEMAAYRKAASARKGGKKRGNTVASSQLYDLTCGCGTGYLKRTVELFPESCITCGASVDKMKVKERVV